MGLRVAVVCSSNMNRSMEAHAVLAKRGFDVRSFGTGSRVKIPGPSKRQPNVYDFGTTYDSIRRDLVAKDARLYTENGMLGMLERNRRIKAKPQRFCEEAREGDHRFDLVLTCQEKVFDEVMADFQRWGEEEDAHGGGEGKPVHVVNMDVVDNPEDATIGAFLLCELVKSMAASPDLDDDIEDIIRECEEKSGRSIMHNICFY